MELVEANEKAAQIFNEETVRPTCHYVPSVLENRGDIQKTATALLLWNKLREEREQPKRVVHEDPHEFKLSSTNFQLLVALFGKLAESDRPAFVKALLHSMDSYASPLIVDFCVRAGYADQLLQAISEATFTEGLLFALNQLEDIVTLNFNIFTDGQLEHLEKTVSVKGGQANKKTYSAAGARGGPMYSNPEYDQKLAPLCKKISKICEDIRAECRQARYWYLKGALLSDSNLEINQDKSKVEDYLTQLGFSTLLRQALNAAEQEFRSAANPFELKNCLGHLRSFLERLHEEACKQLSNSGSTSVKKWGQTTEWLYNNGYLSSSEKNFVIPLYSLLSDQGVHPVIAETEYARLLRNVVIEYGLLLLTRMEKLGQVTSSTP